MESASSSSSPKQASISVMTRHHDDHRQSRVLYDLSTLILNLLRYPSTPISFSDHSPNPPSHSHAAMPPISPAGFASLLLGASLALMLCGSVTFFIGFMLMPSVVALLFVLYVVGVVSSLSMLGSAICSHLFPPPLPCKDVPAWKLM